MSKQIVITKQYHDTGEPPTTGYAISPYSNRYNSNSNFVAPVTQPMTKRQPAQAIPVDVNYEIAVPLQSTQAIVMKTSAVDRAQGFAISTRQLGMVIGFAVTVASIAFAKVPLFSFWSLTIYVLTYAAVWLWAYYYTLKMSAEGVAHYEARSKWGVIAEEQRRRWEHYDRMIGNNNE